MAVAEETREQLIVADPDTGEALDLTKIADADLDALHLYIATRVKEWRLLESTVWHECRRRASENGGLFGRERRWVVKWGRSQSVTVEPREVIN